MSDLIIMHLGRETDEAPCHKYADIIAERDALRADLEAARAEIAALKKPFTVTVEVPELEKGGKCNSICPLYIDDEVDQYCSEHLDVQNPSDWYHPEPGPGCPRYKGGEK